MPGYRSLRDFDWPMLILALAICSLGVLQIFSATHDTAWAGAWWKQVIWVLAGFIAMWFATLIDYHTLLGQIPLLYGLSVATLIGTYAFGMTAFHSRRWIGTTSLHLQVSEFVKLVIVLLVARYMTELKTEQLELPDLLKLVGLVGLPMALVMIQPDLGTALTYLPILAAGVFVAGLRWQYALAILVIVALVLPVGYFFVLKDFQKARLVSFLDANQDPKGSGYQVIQSKIAVGSGALWGQRRYQGHADAGTLPAGAAQGFYFFSIRGRARFCWRNCSVRFVFPVAHADCSKCSNGSGSGRDVYLHGHRDGVVVSRIGERRHGGWKDAGNRHSAAVDELRRVEYFGGIFDAGAGE